MGCLLNPMTISIVYTYCSLQFDTGRHMYIDVEAPEQIVRGEHVGVGITVFNNWYEDEYLKVSSHMSRGV